MDWKQAYLEKQLPLEELVRKIPPRANVVTSHCGAEPKAILRGIAAHKELYDGLQIYNNLIMENAPYCAPEMAGHIHYNSFFVSEATREAIWAGRSDYIPVHYSEVPSLLGEIIPVDVAILSVAPPDEQGYCSLGITVDYQKDAAQKAKLVIAQVNEQMPRTLGDCMVHIDEIDYILKVDEPLPALPQKKIGDVELAIGKNCAELIRDGDTLQLGIGSIPDAVLLSLKGKKDLGLHTEMFSDGAIPLLQEGVINNRKKQLDPGMSVATFLLGSQNLYRYAHENPAVSMRPVTYSNNVCVIAQQDQFVSINSGLQVDLFGQICAESVRGKQFSGVGGQIDFFRGASLSRGGRAILAMPSTAKGGSVSRIVPLLDTGNMVTTTRNDVDYVVTEYGTARLKGKSMRQRAEALIQIAHPAFREELTKKAQV